jgi:hypothetical protein
VIGALYASDVTNELIGSVSFEPENDTVVVIGKVIAPFFAIPLHELQYQLDGWTQVDACITNFSVRLLHSLTNVDNHSRGSNISISENSLGGNMSQSHAEATRKHTL